MIMQINAILRRHSWVAWTLNVATALTLLVFLVDRAPPFSVISVEPASAKPGDLVILRALVHRDTARDCSALFSRYVFDSRQVRFDDIARPTRASDAFIDHLERVDPGRLTLAFVVPAGMAPGPARVETVLHYRCNITHAVWPIEVTAQMPFTVLP